MDKVPCELGGLASPSLRWQRASRRAAPLYQHLPPSTAPYCVFSFFFASKNQLEIDTSKKCSKGVTLRHTWLPCGPKGDFLRHPGVPNLPNMVFYLRKTLISTKSTKLNFGSLLAPFLVKGLPHGAQGCPRQPKGSQKGPHFGAVFRIIFDFLVTQEPEGPGRWPQGAQPPKMMPKASKK